MVEDFNTPLTPRNRLSRQKKTREQKKTLVFNNTLDKDEQYFQKIPFKWNKIHIILKHTWNTFQDMIYYGTKCLNKFWMSEILSCIFSDCNGMKLEITQRKLENSPICVY